MENNKPGLIMCVIRQVSWALEFGDRRASRDAAMLLLGVQQKTMVGACR